MSGPPDNISDRDLWRLIVESPRPSEVVDYPRKGSDDLPLGRLRIQVLSMDEHDEARLKAEYWLKEDKKIPSADLKNPSIMEVYGDAVARHILAMACLKVERIGDDDEDDGPKLYPRLFQGPDDLGKIPANELQALFNAYTLVQHARGPFEGSIESQEELDAWIERLSGGAAATPLAQLSWHQLADLATLLAERVESLSEALGSPDSSSPATSAALSDDSDTGTGSPGSPPAEPTTEGSNASEARLKAGDEITMQQALDMARDMDK